MSVKIKICGLTRTQDIEYVNEALPDYVGFVFAKSKRQVTPETAEQLRKLLDSRIAVVGVFVNEDIDRITSLCKNGIIDIIQLHGDESDEYIESLRQNIDNLIIKAIRVKDSESVKASCSLPCDYLLFDTFSGNDYGGTGKAFDWKLISDIDKPFFLAGGISIDNAVTAIKNMSPYCLDISSGVETDSVKDRNKILNIVNLARSVK
ncbi:phosphoribosylanthranilate isomerase [Ruminiclostridium cellulolyticum]|uniref:N-(5'-phosphoribosyl)anthranilate isomerase n=1 Tax=Ruminiclostridium cellulolyticum (strain ATCC 35319 / DSM 5812 / JCM 6584 / H10) TaxID=394503 RepID=B8I0V1_RUMCH|nr:phosphoribosylanthranilate isomerase [Ruminiclostridium cellulolyticum]ACL77507.1 N-(5'phosphoribosyl)anthranilate isomerase (PRAI) [Ruminiclostridium cellulolyticum H10]